MKRCFGNENGMSMVEVVVSMLLIGTVMMALMTLQGTNTRVSDASGKLSRAVLWANQGLEEAMANVNTIVAGNTTTTLSEGGLRLSRTVTVANTAWPRLVTAAVSWTDSAGVARSVTVSTIVNRRT